jgi:hypothetical protein
MICVRTNSFIAASQHTSFRDREYRREIEQDNDRDRRKKEVRRCDAVCVVTGYRCVVVPGQ